LFSHPNIDVNKGIWTPLYIACQNNHIEVIKLLLSHPNIDVNKKNSDKKTPFQVAKEQGRHEAAKLIEQFQHNKNTNFLHNLDKNTINFFQSHNLDKLMFDVDECSVNPFKKALAQEMDQFYDQMQQIESTKVLDQSKQAMNKIQQQLDSNDDQTPEQLEKEVAMILDQMKSLQEIVDKVETINVDQFSVSSNVGGAGSSNDHAAQLSSSNVDQSSNVSSTKMKQTSLENELKQTFDKTIHQIDQLENGYTQVIKTIDQQKVIKVPNVNLSIATELAKCIATFQSQLTQINEKAQNKTTQLSTMRSIISSAEQAWQQEKQQQYETMVDQIKGHRTTIEVLQNMLSRVCKEVIEIEKLRVQVHQEEMQQYQKMVEKYRKARMQQKMEKMDRKQKQNQQATEQSLKMIEKMKNLLEKEVGHSKK